MLGFHKRTRSLIPVKELSRYDKLDVKIEDEQMELELEDTTELGLRERKEKQRLLMVIYVVFLAEAIMSSSLQPQLKMLIESDDFCGDLSSSYVRSVLDCAYAFGGTAGIFWGYLADRVGRRPVALGGLFGMAGCCFVMGLATDIVSCTIFRFVAGLVSSSVLVVTLTMISDLSVNASERARNVARLPIVAALGSTGPIVQGMVARSVENGGSVWQRFPILSSQIACGSLVFVITIMACIALTETLPKQRIQFITGDEDVDCEKAAFLGQDPMAEDPEELEVRVVDNASRPEPISLSNFLQAPSLIVLLSSFSLLSLHASTFDVLLPHLGHSSSQHGGMGMPCSWLGLIVLLVRIIAGIVVLYTVPKLVANIGLLKPYRACSAFFPAIYVLTPLLAWLAAFYAPLVTALSIVMLLVKHTLANTAQSLVSLLMLNLAPDAFSAGTVVGIMHVANLFRALAVAVSGTSFFIASEVSIGKMNIALWILLAVIGGAGAGLAWWVREGLRVEEDLKSEDLRWERVWDVEA